MKTILSILGTLLILVALFVLIFPIEAGFIRAETHYNSCLRLSTETTTYMSYFPIAVRFSTNGTIYILTEDGKLKEQTGERTKTIATDVQAMLPTDNGVLYTVSETLYLAEEGKTTLVARYVDSFSYNASDIIYSTGGVGGGVYVWKSGQSKLLANLQWDFFMDQILANDTHVICIGSSDILCFNYNGESDNLPFNSDSSNQYFLYNEFLVVVNEGETGAIAYNLKTSEIREINLGWNMSECHNQISVTCSEDKLYLSIYSKLWPEIGDEIRTATVCIDPETWSVETISEQFYNSLVLCDNRLYGLETSLFKNEWAPVG